MDKTLENYQIIQEITNHEIVHRFDTILENKFYGSGLTFLANVHGEIDEQYEEQHFESCYGEFDSSSDCLASKGFQKMRLEITEGFFIDVYNTHLEAGGGNEDHQVRVEQVDLILQSVQSTPPNTAVIFMGDTNLRPSDDMDIDLWNHFFTEGNFVDSCQVTSCIEEDHIDRIWFWESDESNKLFLQAKQWSNEHHFIDEQGVPLSDHPALAVHFSWWIEP